MHSLTSSEKTVLSGAIDLRKQFVIKRRQQHYVLICISYESLLPEIDSHRGDELGVEGAIRELVEEARLADS